MGSIWVGHCRGLRLNVIQGVLHQLVVRLIGGDYVYEWYPALHDLPPRNVFPQGAFIVPDGGLHLGYILGKHLEGVHLDCR